MKFAGSNFADWGQIRKKKKKIPQKLSSVITSSRKKILFPYSIIGKEPIKRCKIINKKYRIFAESHLYLFDCIGLYLKHFYTNI